MDVKIEKIEPIRVVYLRHTGPYENCHTAWEKICAWMAKKQLITDQSLMIGISHDDPETTAPEKIRYDACISVNDKINGDDDIKIMNVGGDNYATYIHVGEYLKLIDSYRKLYNDWLPESGHKARNEPCMEIYIDNPEQVPQEKCRTKICIPIEK